MKTRLMYIELKSGYRDDGPAWIGNVSFSKTGQTIYFNESAFKKKQGINSNYREILTGDEYWISGVKKDGTDRHWTGGGKIFLDKDVVDEYLNFIGFSVLPKKKFELILISKEPIKKLVTEIENEQFEQGFDDNVRFKKLNEITDNELISLLDYYKNLDFSTIHKKARKEFLSSMDDIEIEMGKRNLKVMEE